MHVYVFIYNNLYINHEYCVTREKFRGLPAALLLPPGNQKLGTGFNFPFNSLRQ